MKPGEVFIESDGVSITNFEIATVHRKRQLQQIIDWTRAKLDQLEQEQALTPWWKRLINLAAKSE